MRIEVFRQPEGLRGGREVWVRVLSNDLLDLPRVLEKLAPEDRAEVDGMRLAGYHPSNPGLDVDPDHDYPFEDFWIYDDRTG